MQIKEFKTALYLTLRRDELKHIPDMLDLMKPEDYIECLQYLREIPLYRVRLYYACKYFKEELGKPIYKILDWIENKLTGLKIK